MHEFRPHVVVIGAGFGGLWAAAGLEDAPVDVTLVDRNNYHTFMPLLYQVAAAEIGAEQSVTPVRWVMRKLPRGRFVMAEVTEVDLDERMVRWDGGETRYDYLVIATGARAHFFGIPGARENALPLRSLDQAVAIRNHILDRWEQAAQEPSPERRRTLLTFTIVGAGPTGIEFAGALQELFQSPLRKDFPEIHPATPRIVVLEALQQALSGMPARLGRYAVRRLRAMGVEVQLGSMVSEVTEDCVRTKDGRELPTETVVWTAGVHGGPFESSKGLPLNEQERVPVLPSLQVPGHPEAFVIGDLAATTPPLPMLAAAAMQQGNHTASSIKRLVAGQAPDPFVYKDKGMLAVIGRNTAAARIGRWTFTGVPAWLLWGGVHIVQLIGFRNRLVVLVNWVWDYLLFERAVRMILPSRRTARRHARVTSGRSSNGPREQDHSR